MACLRIMESAKILNGGKSLLDVGCGKGQSMDVFRKMYGEIHGIDISEYAVLSAKKIGMKARKHDLNKNLPYTDAFFTDAICLDVIDYVKNPVAMLKEINRVLTSGGSLAVSIPNTRNINQIMRIVKGSGLKSSDVSESWEDEHIHYFTSRDMEKMLGLAGFIINEKIALVDEMSRKKIRIRLARAILGKKLFREFVAGGILIKACKV